MSSNIISLFNPPPERDLPLEETQDCIPCQVMSTVVALGFGSYLLSGKAFEYSMNDKKKGISFEEFQRRNPKWWRYSLKSLGGSLVVLGLVRGSEGWLWNPEKEYKKF